MDTLNDSATRTVAHLPERPEVTEDFLASAPDVDTGEQDVRPGLRRLGELGLLDTGLPDDGRGGLLPFLGTVESVARGCLSSAFSLWAQRMSLEYLARAPRSPWAEEQLALLATGERTGAGALAPAMKELSGLGSVPVLAHPERGGHRLTGTLPWVSNLFPGAVVAFPARVEEEAGDGRRILVAVRVGDEGVRVRDLPRLMALNGTASSSLELDGARAGEDALISDDLPAFCAGIRTTFLLVQSAFCSGLAVESTEQAASRIHGTTAVFGDDLEVLRDDVASVRARLAEFAQRPPEPAQVTQLRLDAAVTAGTAARLESAVRGGASFAEAGHSSRRLRESLFLPIQSPTEGHLRWDLRR
ncbi:acyl-CoA dehydrogenase family protein [Nocardiopsis salina]|uniref:acyl-CoA dehydrogenase family protein n=1 Tax=Nocardiopsis salina TaxID=245836 RepID=UPI00034BC014|nr:acyl-CoA dehydrogenase family protein [Nocardiopsis salina]